MTRLVFDLNSNLWFLSESNWSFYLKELFPIIKIKIYYNLDLISYFKLNDIYSYLFTYNNFNAFFNNYEFFIILNKAFTPAFYIIIDQLNTFYYNFIYYNFLNILVSIVNINSNIFFFFNNFLSIIFLVFFLFIISLKWHLDFGVISEIYRPNISILYEEFIYSWINFVGIKFESYEEAICVVFLWPWCIFLIFTHIFSIENNEVFFIFIEWGLPVFYGYLLLIENMWQFGSLIFIYLNGARGRRSLVITLIEDLVAFLIVLARINLQVVRGVICGLYHDFFRETVEYIIDTWELYTCYVNWQLPFCKNYFSIDILMFFINWYIIAFILLFIYFILFLQLLFLVIAVWLFCRCWFISIKFHSNLTNYIENLIVKKNKLNV